METLKKCPVCGTDSHTKYLACKDELVTKNMFTIVECSGCKFRFTNPRPEPQNLGKYYESEEYISHSNTSKGFINSAYQIVRKYALGKKLRLVNSLTKGRRILDIGCGTGEFLDYCKNNRWETIGIEPNDGAREFAIKEYGLDIKIESELANFENRSFDVITMWHVLEHVPQLKERVEELQRLIKANGRIVIAVPNCSSLDAKIYNHHWAAYDVPRHLYHFTPETIELLFKQFDLKLESILPMKFDSYYVSMLSENYKRGKSANLRAAFNGFRSNLAAIRSGKKYSSQIYIFRKDL